jgi:hypothetical protein
MPDSPKHPEKFIRVGTWLLPNSYGDHYDHFTQTGSHGGMPATKGQWLPLYALASDIETAGVSSDPVQIELTGQIKETDKLRQEIAESNAICEAATNGPWKVFHDYEMRTILGPSDEEIIACDNSGCASDPSPDYIALKPGDAAFIAHARTALPARNRECLELLAENERLRERVAKLGLLLRQAERELKLQPVWHDEVGQKQTAEISRLQARNTELEAREAKWVETVRYERDQYAPNGLAQVACRILREMGVPNEPTPPKSP